jgi:hypothetical protein
MRGNHLRKALALHHFLQPTDPSSLTTVMVKVLLAISGGIATQFLLNTPQTHHHLQHYRRMIMPSLSVLRILQTLCARPRTPLSTRKGSRLTV